ncbi:succinate dehydrogenase hydrophobic membrane anchor protein [Neisseria gonorrhoeae]|uniref:Succinate dehydrogenase hydrophobic membrane anchor protein n=1 Tax=Neisseria gonorrhoeae TaxID=485 RepID=A0A378VY80_NEIGO|nr:succinate dehydrogenase hydrophobic membrane anchor protein [Neisseria gonorrhoeae]
MVERKLTGAHYGLRDWVMQRATAVIMLIYTVALLVVLFALPKEYPAWQAFFSQAWVKYLPK